jgi:hypothetical protein
MELVSGIYYGLAMYWCNVLDKRGILSLLLFGNKVRARKRSQASIHCGRIEMFNMCLNLPL